MLKPVVWLILQGIPGWNKNETCPTLTNNLILQPQSKVFHPGCLASGYLNQNMLWLHLGTLSQSSAGPPGSLLRPDPTLPSHGHTLSRLPFDPPLSYYRLYVVLYKWNHVYLSPRK